MATGNFFLFFEIPPKQNFRKTGGSGDFFGSIATSAAGADERLNNGTVFASGSLTLTLTNIPYAAYSLVVYDLSGTRFVQSVTGGAGSFFTLAPVATRGPATSITTPPPPSPSRRARG